MGSKKTSRFEFNAFYSKWRRIYFNGVSLKVNAKTRRTWKTPQTSWICYFSMNAEEASGLKSFDRWQC